MQVHARIGETVAIESKEGITVALVTVRAAGDDLVKLDLDVPDDSIVEVLEDEDADCDCPDCRRPIMPGARGIVFQQRFGGGEIPISEN